MSKWVQHKSGVGEKWEVVKEWSDGLSVRNVKDGFIYHVPLSEYVECSPPEEWIDVTQSCESGQSLDAYGRGSMLCKDEHGWISDIFSSCQRQDYRLIKTDGGFRVERKVK